MFDYSVTLFRIWKIPVKLHISLLLFLPYVVFVTTRQFSAIAESLDIPREALRLPSLAWGFILAVGLFVSVLVHELAHCLVARRAGTEVQSISLMMLGGVSRMRGDVPPEREALMAFVGPLTSLLLALLCWVVYRIFPGPSGVQVSLLVLAWMNTALGIFNLLPAFPMDGGRVLRGLLVRRIGRARATRVVTTLGKWMAAAFALFGLFTFNVILILIAAFVYMGASAERSRLEAHDVLQGVPVAKFMTDRLGEAHPAETAAAVARRLLLDGLAGAVVVDGTDEPGRVLGVVTVSELAERAARGAGATPVREIAHADLPTVHARDDAATTLDTLLGSEARAVVVRDENEHILGLVTEAEIQRAVALASLGDRWGMVGRS